MKNHALIVPALLAAVPLAGLAGGGAGEGDDVEAVRQVLELYFEGARTHRAELFEQAFDVEGAHMKGVRSVEGGPEEVRVVPIRDAIESWVRGDPEESSGRVLSIDVVDGKLATATLEILFKGREYVDVMSLYKLDGRWKIVNKVYVSRGAPGSAQEADR